MPDAARLDDKHLCKARTPQSHVGGPTELHVGGPIAAPCSPNVETNSKPQARVTDTLDCTGVGLKNFIVTGSATVEINGKMAARKEDWTKHPWGVIFEGSPNVEIGGRTTGATLGNVAAATKACQDAAKGRTSGSTDQSYENCGVECARQIINQATGKNISEDELLDDAMSHNEAVKGSNRADSGPTTYGWRQTLLARHGVDSTLQPNSMDSIAQAVADGKGVISAHDASILWGPSYTGGHAVLVTGMEYDRYGRLSRVIFNDTGPGSGVSSVRASRFQKSLQAGQMCNVTNDPIF